jgi:hypothetical protein
MIIIYPLFLTFIKLTNGKAQMQVLYPAQVAAIGKDYQETPQILEKIH